MIAVIDNYDSFTYNLVQYLGELAGGTEIGVYRNDAFSVDDILKIKPERIIISPGPGRPEGAGKCPELVRALQGSVPILGVCLGHQVIGQVYGAGIVPARTLMHGKVSKINHDGEGIFQGVKNPFTAARYHSLVVDQGGFPERVLQVSARSEDGEIMGLKHRRYPVWGVQFHPESIISEEGKRILSNFLGREVKADGH